MHRLRTGDTVYARRMTIDARVAQLEAALADLRHGLEAQVSHLRDEVDRLRAQRRHTMRQTHSCPACGAKRILHFTKIADMGKYGPVPMSLHKEFSQLWGTRAVIGQLEAFACTSCELVEWPALSLGDGTPDGDPILELVASDDPAPDSDPYR